MGRFLFGVVAGCAAMYWWMTGHQIPDIDSARLDELKGKAVALLEDAVDRARSAYDSLADASPSPKVIKLPEPRQEPQARAEPPRIEVPTPTASEPLPYPNVRLVRVVDGDTIDVRIDGKAETIRYIGANTPERNEPCYRDAANANRALLSRGPLSLDTDETDSDRYGRLLRYVYAGDVLVERELIRQGWAEVVRYRSDDKHYREFRRLEREAEAQGLGCHSTGIFDDGSDTR